MDVRPLVWWLVHVNEGWHRRAIVQHVVEVCEGAPVAVSVVKKMKLLLLFRFFPPPARGVLEMNGLDKIARRSKRVGGAIADLWGSHLVGMVWCRYGMVW